MKFYKENNTILEAINGNSSLDELKVRSIDAAVVKIEGDLVTVTVGEVIHPMVDNHYIEFIEIETKNGIQRKMLKPGDMPKATFRLIDDEFIKAYAYCNLHGMWDGK